MLPIKDKIRIKFLIVSILRLNNGVKAGSKWQKNTAFRRAVWNKLVIIFINSIFRDISSTELVILPTMHWGCTPLSLLASWFGWTTGICIRSLQNGSPECNRRPRLQHRQIPRILILTTGNLRYVLENPANGKTTMREVRGTKYTRNDNVKFSG